jgi:hypothetical protein
MITDETRIIRQPVAALGDAGLYSKRSGPKFTTTPEFHLNLRCALIDFLNKIRSPACYEPESQLSHPCFIRDHPWLLVFF